MSKPNILIFMVDQLTGTLFADGPANWLHAPNLKALAARAPRVISDPLRNGTSYPWDYQPLQKASQRYMRNHMDLNILEENQRFPRGE